MAVADMTATIKDLASLMGQSDLQREVIEAAANSVASAIQRVPQESRAELRDLLAEFMGDPDDKFVIVRIGMMLRSARSSDQ